MTPELKQQMLDAIKGRLNDERDDVRLRALQSLSMFKETAALTVSMLIEMAIEGDKRQRQQAITTLIGVGEEAIPEIIEKLVNNEDDLDARLVGIMILTEIGLEAEKGSHGGCSSCN